MSNFPPPAQNWPGPARQHHDGPGWALPMIVGAALFAAGCLGGGVAGWFAGVATNLGNAFAYDPEPFDADISIRAPDTVTVGETFDIVVTVTDTGNRQRTLDYVDWQGPMVERLDALSIVPTPDYIDTSGSLREHGYSTTVPASGAATVTFTVRADQPGPLDIDLRVYLDMASEHSTHALTVLPERGAIPVDIGPPDESTPEENPTRPSPPEDPPR